MKLLVGLALGIIISIPEIKKMIENKFNQQIQWNIDNIKRNILNLSSRTQITTINNEKVSDLVKKQKR